MKIYKFTAPWCIACQQLSGMLEPYKGKITEVDIDTDEGMEIANKYQIKSVPTMLIKERGNVVELKINATLQDFLKWLN